MTSINSPPKPCRRKARLCSSRRLSRLRSHWWRWNIRLASRSWTLSPMTSRRTTRCKISAETTSVSKKKIKKKKHGSARFFTDVVSCTGNNNGNQNFNQPGNWRGPQHGGGRWRNNPNRNKFKGKPQGQGQRQWFGGQNNEQQQGAPPQSKGG